MLLIGSWDSPYGLPSRAPSEPDNIGQFDDGMLDHRGLSGGPFSQHSQVLLPHYVSLAPELSTTNRTTNRSCTCLIMRKVQLLYR